jgi:hypothetical protein
LQSERQAAAGFGVRSRVVAAGEELFKTGQSVLWGEHDPALGTIATEAGLKEVATAGGLPRFRRATETPFNRVFEARQVPWGRWR